MPQRQWQSYLFRASTISIGQSPNNQQHVQGKALIQAGSYAPAPPLKDFITEGKGNIVLNASVDISTIMQ